MQDANTVNLMGLDRTSLAAFMAGLGEKAFRAQQILPWIHQRGVTDWSAMTNIGKGLAARLQAAATVRAPELLSEHVSADGTRKWLFGLTDGNAIETVFIPETDRNTLCISSQVGCALDCAFCATAQQGFARNLTAAEIVGQVWFAEHHLRRVLGHDERVLSNIVFMGMGEPLLNLKEVIPAIAVLLDDYAYGLSRRRVTVSTAGVVPAMARLQEGAPVSLAVSLHAPDDALRDTLVPINRKYPIAELLEACRAYVRGDARRRITFEYAMLAGVNDDPQQARALARLLRTVPAKVNLIPFNPFPGTQFLRSAPEAIDRFRDILLQAGLMTVTRRTRGDGIQAACGQLAGVVRERPHRVVQLHAV
ncbi:MAG: 23S rRNA (adenine(2503)-C(2))-methyltransferase RlmN [Gammaproteobacteria bacterium]|nr:23S rRNA (adenine(2503)-C(2))-methyltransferase RlmN [Gammaproteobacteria bacterium]